MLTLTLIFVLMKVISTVSIGGATKVLVIIQLGGQRKKLAG